MLHPVPHPLLDVICESSPRYNTPRNRRDVLVSPVHRSGRVQRRELVEGSNYHLQLEAVLKMTANVHNRTRTRSRRQKQKKTPLDIARNFQPCVNRISVLESRLGKKADEMAPNQMLCHYIVTQSFHVLGNLSLVESYR